MPPRRKSNIGRITRRNRQATLWRQNRTAEEKERIRIHNSQVRAEKAQNREADINIMIDPLEIDYCSYSEIDIGETIKMEPPEIDYSSYLQIGIGETVKNEPPEIDYCSHSQIDIGERMDKVCQHCNAMQHEIPGTCCAAGKVVLLELNAPPEPLESKPILTNNSTMDADRK